MKELLSGVQDSYESDFLELYLQVIITKNSELFLFQINFVYDTSDSEWKKVSITETMNTDKAQRMGSRNKAFEA